MKKNLKAAKRRMRIIFIAGVAIVLLICLAVAIGVEKLFVVTGILAEDIINDVGIGSLLVLFITSILVGSLLAVFASKLLFKPVNELIDGLEKLSQGDYSTRIEFNSKTSMVNVSDAFNSCAEELQKTEILRSDFINNFSHEFKTPIASINGFIKLLERGNLPQEKQKKYLQIIREETERLSEMTTNILTLTKVESQEILTGKSKFYLSEQIRSCALLLERKWQEKRLKIVFDFKEKTICANEEMLKEVWLNLLDNAIKYAEYDSELTVRIKDDENDAICVEVENEGAEIKEADKERIFQKFYQVNKESSTRGNGIGLSIVKKIVELHKGSVRVECENGKTVFTVSLPKN